MEPSDVVAIERLTRLAFEFGPFLFAILCLVFITWRAHGYYREATTNESLPASVLRTHTIVYLGAWCLSALLVIGSCVWWLFNYTGTSVHSFEIRGLKENEFVTSPDEFMYTRARQQALRANITPTKDVVFAVVSGEQLEQIAPFRVRYLNTDTGNWTEFEVPYGRERLFRIVDGELKIAGNAAGGSSLRLARTAPAARLVLAQFSERSTSKDVEEETRGYRWKSPKYEDRLKNGKKRDDDGRDRESLELDPAEKYQILQQMRIRRRNAD